ncbi:rhomboid family intramembrane serine protease [Helcobacillus massiliensis]|uniref:rhomboid family intramembrane serine protease n=1 Tax=Helcobacillus massiliensis TaxID=521392 RepID=UPI0025527B59|nr:rhomboid family intramembrane serine protease [Helcobacillus massiliensis]MDK7741266.1 rhomboid family intramembrane serine protease [Helcobacillus massiliensis]WOO92880.1 rhomboid family intramembrane serine protease [Helcobacillus massiliensis]
MSQNPPSFGQSGSSGAAHSAPVCPRHPQVASYVRCRRCDRPMCGACQVHTEVGAICTDCAGDLQRDRAAAQPRNAIGGRGSDTPIITWTLIGICVVMFGLQNLPGVSGVIRQWTTFAPFRTEAMPWTLITSGFLHGGIMHLLLNMYALWAIGQFLERSLGRWRYLGLFLLSVIGGHAAVMWLASAGLDDWYTGTVGASGGVFGLFGALFVVQQRMGEQATQVLVLIGLNFAFSFMYPDISWQGHLGGMITGTLIALVLFATRVKAAPGADRAALARRADLTHAAVLAAALAVLGAVVLARVLTVPDWAMPPLF